MDIEDRLRKVHGTEFQNASDLYRAVGYALTQWSVLEETLCSIYILAVGPDPAIDTAPAGAAFWAVVTFDGKLKMTQAAVNLWIRGDTALEGEWNALFNKMTEKSKDRNNLAHGSVITAVTQERPETFFAPSLFRHRYTSEEEWPISVKNRLSAQQIYAKSDAFRRLAQRLRDFRSHLREDLTRREAMPPPSPEAAQERRRRATIRSRKGTPIHDPPWRK